MKLYRQNRMCYWVIWSTSESWYCPPESVESIIYPLPSLTGRGTSYGSIPTTVKDCHNVLEVHCSSSGYIYIYLLIPSSPRSRAIVKVRRIEKLIQHVKFTASRVLNTCLHILSIINGGFASLIFTGHLPNLLSFLDSVSHMRLWGSFRSPHS